MVPVFWTVFSLYHRTSTLSTSHTTDRELQKLFLAFQLLLGHTVVVQGRQVFGQLSVWITGPKRSAPKLYIFSLFFVTPEKSTESSCKRIETGRHE